MITIGLIDDHEIFRVSFRSYLEMSGCYTVVIEASNGQQFLDTLELVELKPDIVLTDFQMPGLSGLDVSRELKLRYPDIKVVQLTAYCHHHLVCKMAKEGADGLVAKSASLEVLNEVIQRVLNGIKVFGDEAGDIHNFFPIAGPTGEFPTLSPKQVDFIKLCAVPHHTYKAIANELQLSPKTVDRYRDILFKKLNVTSRTGLTIYALQNGIINLSSLS
ncbi:MAG: response regulator transcription factor [Chitinophagaceae bacterium]|nr:response regulator transcription factor [Chitinophagaceae bacterium]